MWSPVEVGRIPALGLAAHEEPLAVAAFVGVEHAQHDRHPSVADLVFGAHHHLAGGVVGIDKLDDVLAQVVRGAGELFAQRVGLPGLEVRAAHLVAAHADVRREQVDVRIHVAHVQRQ